MQLVELFGSARDKWIKEDLAGWLAPNRIYDGVPGVLNALLQREELYIVTTKQASPQPVELLIQTSRGCALAELAGMQRAFAVEAGALKGCAARSGDPDCRGQACGCLGSS